LGIIHSIALEALLNSHLLKIISVFYGENNIDLAVLYFTTYSKIRGGETCYKRNRNFRKWFSSEVLSIFKFKINSEPLIYVLISSLTIKRKIKGVRS